MQMQTRASSQSTGFSQMSSVDSDDDDVLHPLWSFVPRYSIDEALSGAGPSTGPVDNYKIPEPK
jgi:hypothetical protein